MLLRSSQVARELGVSTASVQRWAREGFIPATQTYGGHYRFDLAAVRAALEAHQAR